jgi:hypothetical protein
MLYTLRYLRVSKVGVWQDYVLIHIVKQNKRTIKYLMVNFFYVWTISEHMLGRMNAYIKSAAVGWKGFVGGVQINTEVGYSQKKKEF